MNDPICAVCGESKNINLLMFDHGLCLCHRCNAIAAHAFIKTHAEKKLKEAEEATQMHIADLSIENNRLRTELKDLEKAHSDFLDRCFWVFWAMLCVGVVAGVLGSLIVK